MSKDQLHALFEGWVTNAFLPVKVYAMDKDPQRLRLARDFGMTPVDVTAHPDVGEYLLSIEQKGFDRAIEARGLRAIRLERDSSDTVAAIIHSLKKGGYLSMISDFFFTTHDFPIGAMMQKGLTVRGGQAHSQKVCLLLSYNVGLSRYH